MVKEPKMLLFPVTNSSGILWTFSPMLSEVNEVTFSSQEELIDVQFAALKFNAVNPLQLANALLSSVVTD